MRIRFKVSFYNQSQPKKHGFTDFGCVLCIDDIHIYNIYRPNIGEEYEP